MQNRCRRNGKQSLNCLTQTSGYYFVKANSKNLWIRTTPHSYVQQSYELFLVNPSLIPTKPTIWNHVHRRRHATYSKQVVTPVRFTERAEEFRKSTPKLGSLATILRKLPLAPPHVLYPSSLIMAMVSNLCMLTWLPTNSSAVAVPNIGTDAFAPSLWCF